MSLPKLSDEASSALLTVMHDPATTPEARAAARKDLIAGHWHRCGATARRYAKTHGMNSEWMAEAEATLVIHLTEAIDAYSPAKHGNFGPYIVNRLRWNLATIHRNQTIGAMHEQAHRDDAMVGVLTQKGKGGEFETCASGDPTLADVLRNEDIGRTREALDQLPSEKRELLERNVVDEEATADIAAERGTSASTIQRRIRDAKFDLAAELTPHLHLALGRLEPVPAKTGLAARLAARRTG